MVVGFLVHTVTPGLCRVLFSFLFETEGAQDIANEQELRALRKEQAMHVACQVQSEYTFRRASATFGSDPTSSGPAEDDHTAPESGVFRLQQGLPFTGSAKMVVWQAALGTGYCLVCEPDENRLLAENVLCLIMKYIQDHVKSAEQPPAEIMLKADRVTAVLHQFLPNGQLLFLNHRAVKQLEKELELMLAK